MYQIRSAEPNDYNFVLNAWLKRYRDAVSRKLVTDKIFFATQHEVIVSILKNPDIKVLIACNPDDPDQIFGYIVAEQVNDINFVHWVYVKGVLRRLGIATALIKEALKDFTGSKIQYSHRTHLVEFLDKENTATYNPSYVWSML